MFMSKVKTAMGLVLAAGIVAGGAGVLAQQGSGYAGGPPPVPRSARYEIRVWVDGKLTGEPIIAEVENGQKIVFGTPNEMIQIHRKPQVGGGGSETGLNVPANDDGRGPARKGVDRRGLDLRKAAGAASPDRNEGENSQAGGATGRMMMGMMGGGVPGGAVMGAMPGGAPQTMSPISRPGTGSAAAGSLPSDNLRQRHAGSMMSSAMMDMSGSRTEEPAVKPGADGSGSQGVPMPGMSAMMGSGGMAGPTPAPAQELRLQSVERKLDEILKRLEDRTSEKPR